jgi:hypothetical protein
MRADGSWALSALAGVVARQGAGTSQGLSSAACVTPGREWWFTGAGSQFGRGAALLVSNAADEPARFDISLYSGAGPVPVLGGRGIDLGPTSSVRLRLDALAPDEELVAIQVTSTRGRVAAAVRDVALSSEEGPRGVDFIPPAQSPGNRLVIAGIPSGDGARDLLLVNHGTQFATVTARLLTESGPVAPDGLATIAVPAGAIIQVDLTGALLGRPGTLDLTSDVPVTGGARAAWGGARQDVMWLSAVPLLGGRGPLGGAAAVPSGPGLSTTVTVAAPDSEVRGTLTIVTSQSPDLSALSGESDVGDSGAEGRTGADLPELVVPPDPLRTATIPVTVPAGSQVAIPLPDAETEEPAGITSVSWRSDAGSGPAAASHLVLDEDVPLATGYPWWPVPSVVASQSVREDLSILAPVA